MKDDAEFTPPWLHPLAVQLLYKAPPKIDFERLAERVEAYCGRIDPKTRAQALPAEYSMPEVMAEFEEGAVPSQLCLAADAMPADEQLEAAVESSWDWVQAREAVSECRYALIANDAMASPLESAVRNGQFRGFVRAILEVAPCEAIYSLNSQWLISPERFAEAQRSTTGDQYYGSIHVRIFNLKDTDDEMIVDTLGLSWLGVPDLQCHFRGLSEEKVAMTLYSVGCYLLQNGDIVEDGETVGGIEDDDQWECQHEMALTGPERMVLDLNPGEPYAAGR